MVKVAYCFRAGAVREKALSLGQSVRSSASTVRYPHEERPKFLTCQKFIRPSDCLSGETYRFSFPPVHCTNTARQTTHDKAEIRPDSKNSRTSQNSARNRTKIAQCMPGISEHFSFAEIIHPPHRCGISRCWLDSMIIAQVCLRLATIKGHSKMCKMCTA